MEPQEGRPMDAYPGCAGTEEVDQMTKTRAKMTHIRVDNEPDNTNRRFACGLGPELPEGDTYYFAAEPWAERADCPGCNSAGHWAFGTPLSELSGRPGHKGYDEFVRIANSWGFP